MKDISKVELERITKYVEENYSTYYEWLNGNSAVCEKYGITEKEFLEIMSFELVNNRVVPDVWKEILSTAVGLSDGTERTSIKEFYDENRFCEEDIYDATMYASHTFSKHAIKNSHRDIIGCRFELHKKLSRTCETEEENKYIAQVLSDIGVPSNNVICRFLTTPELTLENAAKKTNKSIEEIEREISMAVTILKNRQNPLFDYKPAEEDHLNRIDVICRILDAMDNLTSNDKELLMYIYGIPEGLTKADFENGNIELNKPHTLGEAATEFGMTVERVRLIFRKIIKRGRCVTRRKRLRDYLD